MALDLDKVDLTAVNELAKIKAERDQLAERLKCMGERQGQVSVEVYQRVQGDYQRRLDELTAQAAPLKLQAGAIYRSLRDNVAALAAQFEAARLDREEVEFRHSLGEFDDKTLKQKLQSIDQHLGSHNKAREQALTLQAQFLAVVESESELDGCDDDTARMDAIREPPPSATVAVGPIRGPAADSAATLQAPALRPPPADAATVATPIAATAPSASTAIPNRAVSRSSRNPDATVVFRQGRLEPLNAEAGTVVQALGLKPISIGSGPGCDLQLSAAGVAKRHAEILMTRAGFCVRDLGSSGATKVNGEPTQEQVLAEGDNLAVGSAQFHFRLL